jgi:ribosomal-protein-alanine N-acetyltransferase
VTPEQACQLNGRLETTRLVLEPLTAAHADVLFAPFQAAAVYTWISAIAPKHVDSLRTHWAKLETRLSPQGDAAWLAWAVRRVGDGAYVGKMDAEVDAAGVATNIGYLFFPDYWGHGYATEAVIAVVGHCVQLGIAEMRATVTLGNDVSARVLEKAGFVRTRIIPDNDVIRGESVDDVEYVFLAPTPRND